MSNSKLKTAMQNDPAPAAAESSATTEAKPSAGAEAQPAKKAVKARASATVKKPARVAAGAAMMASPRRPATKAKASPRRDSAKADETRTKAKPAKTTIPAAGKDVAKANETDKPGKEKKLKLVRESFTFPAVDYARIGILKQRALKAGHEVKKSELLRAGLIALCALSDATLLRALGAIAKLKPGRPAK